jgi:divalent metal cation (Fe/Co/Zn/Cd) transporter
MSTSLTTSSREHGELARQLRLLSWLTIVWLAIDGVIGMTAGIASDSVVLIGWGLSCAIEAAAATILIWRFSGHRLHSQHAERLAQRVVGATFILLVPYIVVQAIDHLITGNTSGVSWIGLALAASDALLMPFLGHAKTRLGRRLNSSAATGAGKQNIICAYLSVAVIIGLGANALFGAWWADPIAGLLVAVVCLRAGTATWRGKNCDTITPA